MKRTFILLYGLACYAVFLATFLYAVGFVGNFAVPRSIDSPPESSLAQAIFVDVLLLALFALQHSVMARPVFKRWFTQYIPESAERSTYVIAASVALIVLFAFWQPLGGTVWHVESPVAAGALHLICALGWALVLFATFLINHFDLFGLRQVYVQFMEETYWPVPFRTPGPYGFVRHPLYLGFLIAFWATPTMSAAHLLFAAMTTAYILVAIQLEERDLVDSLGSAYREYRERVPMIIPSLKRSQHGSSSRRLGNADVH